VPLEYCADIAINQLVEKLETIKEVPEKLRLLRGKVKTIACTQTGSRFLQKEVEL